MAVHTASATDYYVAPNGNDANSGRSLNDAWATLAKSETYLKPGDTLYVADGTYYDDRFVASSSGTPDQPITIKAYSGTPTFINKNVEKRSLISFHDRNYGNVPGPISYFNVEDIKAVNYDRAFFIGYDSHHIKLEGVSTDQGSTGFFAGPRTHHIVTKDMTINGSWWNGWYIWHDNYEIDAINVTVTNQNEHSAFDLHTNNDNIRLIDCSAYNSLDNAPGVYMGHGDYGTDDYVTIKNFRYEGFPNSWMFWVWNPGEGLYIEDATSIGSRGVEIMGEGNDLTLKDITIDNTGVKYHGLYFTYVKDISNVLIENVDIRNVDKSYYDIKFESGFDAMSNVDIVNPSGDNNDITIQVGSGTTSTGYDLEFTDGTVFSENYATTDPLWDMYKSSIKITETGGKVVKTYPMTAQPSSGTATVEINKFDTSLPQGNTIVDFTASSNYGNNVQFAIEDLKPGHYYNVKRGSSVIDTLKADSLGRIEFSNSDWSVHTFTVEETSTSGGDSGSSSGDEGEVQINRAPVLNPIGDKNAYETDTLVFKVSATDSDGDALEYSSKGLPAGASLEPESGIFTWTPQTGQAGTYQVTIEVTDGYLSDSESIAIDVNVIAHTPVIDSFYPMNNAVFDEGDTIDIKVGAHDEYCPDINYIIKIDGVVYSTGAEYSWNTDSSSAGTHQIEVIVTDGINEVTSTHNVKIDDVQQKFDPMMYDTDSDGTLSKPEVTAAVQDYYMGNIARKDIIEVVYIYFNA